MFQEKIFLHTAQLPHVCKFPAQPPLGMAFVAPEV